MLIPILCSPPQGTLPYVTWYYLAVVEVRHLHFGLQLQQHVYGSRSTWCNIPWLLLIDRFLCMRQSVWLLGLGGLRNSLSTSLSFWCQREAWWVSIIKMACREFDWVINILHSIHVFWAWMQHGRRSLNTTLSRHEVILSDDRLLPCKVMRLQTPHDCWH